MRAEACFGDIVVCGNLEIGVYPNVWFQERRSVYWEGLAAAWYDESLCNCELNGTGCPSVPYDADPPGIPGFGLHDLEGVPLCTEDYHKRYGGSQAGRDGIDCACSASDFAPCQGDAAWVAVDLNLDGTGRPYRNYAGLSGDDPPYEGEGIPRLRDYDMTKVCPRTAPRPRPVRSRTAPAPCLAPRPYPAWYRAAPAPCPAPRPHRASSRAAPACVLLLLAQLAAGQVYSVDQFSPSYGLYAGIEHRPDDLLWADPPEATGEDVGGVGPAIEYDGERLPRNTVGTFGALDIDAISSNHGLLEVQCLDSFQIVFSVTIDSQGNLGTAVRDQFDLAQVGGDLFTGSASFRPVLPAGAHEIVGVAGDNDLYINQDVHHLVRSVGPEVLVVDAVDELDGFDFLRFDTDGDGALDIPLYYSVTFDSDPFMGSIIFRLPEGWDTAPEDPWELAPVYADPVDLLLQTQDEIDALVVHDGDDDGVFNEGDGVLISLHEGSWSLQAGWPYSIGTFNDVFLVYRDEDGVTHLSVLARGAELGLADTHDDVDGLEVIVIVEGIGDADEDCDVDLADHQYFSTCMGGPGMFVTGLCTLLDGDADGDVDLADAATFARSFTGTPGEHDCCQAGAPGCVDPATEACVCAADPYCCETAWDAVCIAEVDTLGCGQCGEHDCCAVGGPGCANANVEGCVCAQDAFCCETAWDELCVSEVETFACGICG